MRVVVIGAGLQARAICHALLSQDDVDRVVLADVSKRRALSLASTLNDPRVDAHGCDASNQREVEELLGGARAAISAVPYRLNLTLARAAIAAGCSFCDLGGNNETVSAELALHAEAQRAGVTIIPDCGLAPGLGSIVTAHAMQHMGMVDSLSIRCGGIPQERDGFLNYALFFSEEGLINEYVEDAMVLVDGEIQKVPSLDAFEEVDFGPPYTGLEAFTTSGGASTLPETYRWVIDSLDYKTIRWRGHGEVFRAMKRLGLLSSDYINLRGRRLSPRAVVENRLAATLDRDVPDVVLFRVTARNSKETRIYEAVELPADGMSAMARMTGFPAALVLLTIARRQVSPGAWPQETCLDPDPILRDLRGLGVDLRQRAA